MGATQSRQVKMILEFDTNSKHTLKLSDERNIIDKYYLFFKPRKPISLKKRKYISLSLINQNKKLVEGHKISLNNIHRGKTTKINGKSVLIYTYETDSSSINLKINEKNCLYEISYTTIANSNPALSS